MLRTPFVSGVLLSAVTGAIVLGAGGRIAMRVYALREWQAPYFTASGTFTVVVIAAAAGAAIGGWLWLADRLFLSGRPDGGTGRYPRLAAHQLFFWTGLLLLLLRVLSPVSRSALEVFSPLILIHGVVLLVASRRILGTRQRLPSIHRLSSTDVIGLSGDRRRGG